jgi:DnaJ-class molecular chaperone
MTGFKLWTPGRAPAYNKKISENSKCETCNGTGEEDVRSVALVGFSYIPCAICKGSGLKFKLELVKNDS